MIGTDPREAKLPVWARTYIERLRRVAQDAERDRDEARLATNPAESDTVLDAYASIPIGLGKSPNVRFRLGSEERSEWIDVRTHRDHEGKTYVEVRSGDSLLIRPQVTNVVRIEVTR